MITIDMHGPTFVLALAIGLWAFLGIRPFSKANPFVVAVMVWIAFYVWTCVYQGENIVENIYYFVLLLVVVMPLQVVLAFVMELVIQAAVTAFRRLPGPGERRR